MSTDAPSEVEPTTKLILVCKNDPTLHWLVKHDKVVGRGSPIDLSAVPDSDRIAMRHARFQWDAKRGWLIQRLEKSSSTVVGGWKLGVDEYCPMGHGTPIIFADIEFFILADRPGEELSL